MNGLTDTLTQAPNQLRETVSAVDWANPTWDLFLVLFCILGFFIYGISLGRERVVLILMSLYVAMALVANAPFISETIGGTSWGTILTPRLLTFIVTFVVVLLILSRAGLFSASRSVPWWQSLLLSLFHVGLFVSVILSYLPEGAIEALSPVTRQAFLSPIARFVWLVSPLVALILFRGRRSYRRGRDDDDDY